MANSISTPFPFFAGLDGKALVNGKIYIGDDGLDARTNPKATFFDEALTEPAAQPVRTIAGYASDAGGAAQLFTDGAYSISVYTAADVLVFSSLSEAGDIAVLQAEIDANTADIATNTADIATNTADIATNTADIVALQTAVVDVFPIVGSWVYSSNVTTLEFTDLEEWDAVDIVFAAGSSSAVNQIRVSTNNGSTYATSGYIGPVGDSSGETSTTDSLSITRSGSGVIAGVVSLRNMSTSGATISSSALAHGATPCFSGGQTSSGIHNAIQILSSGSFTSGNVTVYGVRRAP